MVTSHNILFNGNEKCKDCGSSDFYSLTSSVQLKCNSCGRIYPDYNKSSKKDGICIFGYGSLILPTSLISRFKNLDIDTDDIYSRDSDVGYLRAQALIEYDSLGFDFFPCKLSGYNRKYSFDSERGGKMIECHKSSNNFVNGVIYSGINNEQYERISSTEYGYSIEELNKDDFYFYADQIDSSKVFIFISDSGLSGNFKERNRVYHKRVLTGIKMIGDKYDSSVMQEFFHDFENSFH